MVLLIFWVFSFCFIFSFSLLCVNSSRVSSYVSAAQIIKRNRKKSAKKTCIKICGLFKLGKSKDIIKYICLSLISFLPSFYFCCIHYFGSLIFCCQFVAIKFYIMPFLRLDIHKSTHLIHHLSLNFHFQNKTLVTFYGTHLKHRCCF